MPLNPTLIQKLVLAGVPIAKICLETVCNTFLKSKEFDSNLLREYLLSAKPDIKEITMVLDSLIKSSTDISKKALDILRESQKLILELSKTEESSDNRQQLYDLLADNLDRVQQLVTQHQGFLLKMGLIALAGVVFVAHFTKEVIKILKPRPWWKK